MFVFISEFIHKAVKAEGAVTTVEFSLSPQIAVFYRASPRHKLKIVKVRHKMIAMISLLRKYFLQLRTMLFMNCTHKATDKLHIKAAALSSASVKVMLLHSSPGIYSNSIIVGV